MYDNLSSYVQSVSFFPNIYTKHYKEFAPVILIIYPEKFTYITYGDKIKAPASGQSELLSFWSYCSLDLNYSFKTSSSLKQFGFPFLKCLTTESKVFEIVTLW